MASVKWSGSGLNSLGRLDPLVRERVLSKVSWLEENFANIVPEKLHGDLKNAYKLRIGDLRILYSLRGNLITIEDVGHRRDVYR